MQTIKKYGRLPVTPFTAFLFKLDEGSGNFVDSGPANISTAGSTFSSTRRPYINEIDDDGDQESRVFDNSAAVQSGTAGIISAIAAYAELWQDSTIGTEAGFTFGFMSTGAKSNEDIVGITGNGTTTALRDRFRFFINAGTFTLTFQRGTSGVGTLAFNNLTVSNNTPYLVNVSRKVVTGTTEYICTIVDLLTGEYRQQRATTGIFPDGTGGSTRIRIATNPAGSANLNNAIMWDLRLETKASTLLEVLHYANQMANPYGDEYFLAQKDIRPSIKVLVRDVNPDSAGIRQWKDLSNLLPGSPLPGDVLYEASWGAGIEQALSANVRVMKSTAGGSLSPEMIDSAYNRELLSGNAVSGTWEYVPLLDGHKEIAILVASEPNPLSYYYQNRFLGRINRVSCTNNSIDVTCDGFEEQANQVQMEEESFYGGGEEPTCSFNNSTDVLRVFATGHQMVQGDIFYVTNIDSTEGNETYNGTELVVSSVDANGFNAVLPSTPDLEINVACNVYEPLEQVYRKMISKDPLPDGTELQIVYNNDPDWAVKGFTQPAEHLYVALDNLAAEFAGTLKEVWSYDVGHNILTLQAPERLVVPNYILSGSRYDDFKRFETHTDDVRNYIRIRYESEEPDGETLYDEVFEDTGSQARYGTRKGLLYGVRNLTPDDTVELDALGDEILLDLADAPIQAVIDLQFLRMVDLYQLVRVEPDNRNIDSTKDWAVVSYRHVIGPNQCITSLELAGKVTRRHNYWLGIPTFAAEASTTKGGTPIGMGSGDPVDIYNPANDPENRMSQYTIAPIKPIVMQQAVAVFGSNEQTSQIVGNKLTTNAGPMTAVAELNTESELIPNKWTFIS